jgi:hypothetical protein
MEDVGVDFSVAEELTQSCSQKILIIHVILLTAAEGRTPPGPSGLIADWFSLGTSPAPGRYGHFDGYIFLG